MNKDIKDFGQKIGGARKDLRGTMTREDLDRMTPEERLKYVVKDMIWPAPDYANLVEEGGYTQRTAAAVKMVRESLPPAPTFNPSATQEERIRASEAYFEIASLLRSAVEGAKGNPVEMGEHLSNHPEFNEKMVKFSVRIKEVMEPVGGTYRSAWKNCHVAEAQPWMSEQFRKAFYASRGPIVEVASAASQFRNGQLDTATERLLKKNPHWPEMTSRAAVKARKDGIGVIKDGEEYFIGLTGYRIQPKDSQEMMANRGYATLHGCRFPEKAKAIEALLEVAETKVKADLNKTKERRERLKQLAEGVSESQGLVSSAIRQGPDYRGMVDVVQEDFIHQFGMRGGEFGNYVTQEERQFICNRGFDAFADMATAYSLPPSCMSLEGTLAVAFGSRGRNGAYAAHYEPGRKVFNLTKPSGAGCMAHEWGHAYDHFLGLKAYSLGIAQSRNTPAYADYLSNLTLKAPRTDVEMGKEEKFVRDAHALIESLYINTKGQTKDELVEAAKVDRDKWRAELVAMVKYQAESLPNLSEEMKDELLQNAALLTEPKGSVVEAVGKLRDASRKALKMQSSETRVPMGTVNVSYQSPTGVMLYLDEVSSRCIRAEGALQEVEQLPTDHVKSGSPRRTNYAKQVSDLDGKRTNRYYSLPHEMFARTFESALCDRMAEKNMNNDFLVDGVNGMAFPQGKERERFSRELNGLMDRMHEITRTVDVPGVDFQRRALLTQKEVAAANPEMTEDIKELCSIGQIIEPALAGFKAPTVVATPGQVEAGQGKVRPPQAPNPVHEVAPTQLNLF